MSETPYLVRLFYDQDHGPPHDEWDTIFRVQVADSHRYDSSERAQMAACGHCGLNDHYEPSITAPDGRKLYFDNDEGEDPHEWKPQPDTIYFLDQRGETYYLVEPGREPPEDYTDIDGIMELTKRGRDEWCDMTAEQRKSIAEGELEEYNKWRSGDVYVAVVLKRQPECDECGHVPDPMEIEACGGFFGEESITEFVKEAIASDSKIPYADIKEHTHYETEYA